MAGCRRRPFPPALPHQATPGWPGSLLWRPRRKPFWLAQPAAQRDDITVRGFALPALPGAARRSGLIAAFVALASPHFTLRAREGFKPDHRHTKPRWTTKRKADLPASQSIAKRGKGFSLSRRRRRCYFFAGGRGETLSSLINYRAPNRPQRCRISQIPAIPFQRKSRFDRAALIGPQQKVFHAHRGPDLHAEAVLKLLPKLVKQFIP